ncbi:MAG: acetyl-CoA C-acyltransferase [Gammaproteobacteria bacterium]
MKDPIVIVGLARTPVGNLLGCFKDITAPQLGSVAIQNAVSRSQIDPQNIDEVIMGCVLPAGLGQAPARQAALGAGLEKQTGATTINKMCGSGMKAVMLAHDQILSDAAEIMVAGGMESMTNAPYLALKARAGYRLGHAEFYDHMCLDGLEDAYDKGKPMGAFAEMAVQKYGFTREQLDEFALNSVKRAQKAEANGSFSFEIAPVTVKTKQGETIINQDEGPMTAKPEKIPTLKPVFAKDGRITPANSSSISDGAAALVLMKQSKAKALGLHPLAMICGHATHAQDPAWFTTAPVGAIQKLFTKLHWNVKNVDLFEINEAFAVVTMAAMHDLSIPIEKVNIHGGACVLGHPIGASGARILVTLIAALKQKNLKRGVAALCIGGGEATAMGVEILL